MISIIMKQKVNKLASLFGVLSILLGVASFALLKIGSIVGFFTVTLGLFFGVTSIIKKQKILGLIGLFCNILVIALFIYFAIVLTRTFNSPEFQNSWNKAFQNF